MTVYIKNKNGNMHVYENVQSVDTYLGIITLMFMDGTNTSMFEFDNDIVDIEE